MMQVMGCLHLSVLNNAGSEESCQDQISRVETFIPDRHKSAAKNGFHEFGSEGLYFII